MKKLFTQKEFETLQQRYNRMYFDLFKKYWCEKELLKKARVKIETMFINNQDEMILDDLIELYDILNDYDNSTKLNRR